jgi:hypothetical protein
VLSVAMKNERYFRFEDESLQQALVDELDRAGLTYTRGADRTVAFTIAGQDEIMNAILRIRDAQFPWYLLMWKKEAEAVEYRDAFKSAGLPFIVERHENGVSFLVRREDRSKHDEIWSNYIPRGP